MIFKINNKKIFVLTIILIVSTGLATVIQFIKGRLFEAALNVDSIYLFKLVGVLGILILGEVLFYYFEWKYENYLTRETIANQKNSILNQALHIDKFDNIDEKIATSSNLLVNVVDSLEYNYYFAWFESIYLVLRIIFVTASILYINVYMGVVIILFLFMPLLVTKVFKNKVSELEKRFAEQRGNNLDLYKNLFDNLKNIRILNTRDLFFNSVKNQVEKERVSGQKTKEYRLTMNAIYSFLSYSLHFFTLVASIFLICEGKIRPGMVITLLGLTEQLSLPIISLAKNITSINSTQQLREDISAGMQYVDVKEQEINLLDNLKVEGLEVKLGNQHICYNDLVFQVGKKYLIEGTSGIGKTVLLNAMTGLVSACAGQILYDGKKMVKNQNPFNDIFYCQADNVLFKNSGIYNILLKDECTDFEIEYMKRFIGEEQLYVNDATKLSTGEKRRILNLRGLMSKRNILIFDEPVANIDQKNSELFWKEVLKTNKTVIVVSHETPDWVRKEFDSIIDFKKVVSCKDNG